MNILFLGYWSIEDSLSEATIRPHLEILNSFEKVNKIIYVSIERSSKRVKCSWEISKLIYIPYYSDRLPFLLDKIKDFTVLPRTLIRICQDKYIDKIICRSSPAGAIGYIVSKWTKIPFYVESFEPHAAYMLASQVWGKWSLQYTIQRFFELKQKQAASWLMPVSENYKKRLIKDPFVNGLVKTIPCSVNLDNFKYSNKARVEIREQLKIKTDDIVGIYVGKFGGLYFDKEAFEFIKDCFKYIVNFFLIVLTPNQDEFLMKNAKHYGFPLDKIWFGKVDHGEVSKYLSASDFAFSFHKNYSWSSCFSPIKNGEYWANGLPILISEGIGDDSDIINNIGGGLVVDFVNGENSKELKRLKQIIADFNEHRNTNQSVKNARKHRGQSTARKVYSNLVLNDVSG